MKDEQHRLGCGCDGDCNRRDFLAAMGTASGALAFCSLETTAMEQEGEPAKQKKGANVQAAFLYPPSNKFTDDPDGWWSWPGNQFDAEGRQKQYASAFREMEKRLGMTISADDAPIATTEEAQRFAESIKQQRPDGIVLVMFYNRSLSHADLILAAAEEAGIPAIFFIGLGVKHGRVDQYRRPGVYFIQSLDNLDAIEYGVRMINTRKLLGQSRILSITEADSPREGTEKFFGITVRVIPFSQYAEIFRHVTMDDEAREFLARFKAGTKRYVA